MEFFVRLTICQPILCINYDNVIQNHRQKVVNRGLYVCAGGFTFVHGGLTFNFDKIPLIYAVSYFNLRGLELSLGGKISPPNPPGATGMASLLDCFDILYSFHHVFFKENVKYPI